MTPLFRTRRSICTPPGSVAYTPSTPVLFVHHGVGRNGAAYRDYWLPLAEEHDILAIALEFPEASFPDYLRYHFGNMHNEDGTPNPREKWTYGIVPRLFDALRDAGVTMRERYGVFGHSAGGQFVHRMLSFGFRDKSPWRWGPTPARSAMPDLMFPGPSVSARPRSRPTRWRPC